MANLNLNKNCTLKYYYIYCFCRPPIIFSILHLLMTISVYYHDWSDIISPSRLVSVLTVVFREIVTLALLTNTSDNDYFYVGNFAGMLWVCTTLYNILILLMMVLQFLLTGSLASVNYCLKHFNRRTCAANMNLVAAGTIDLEGNCLAAETRVRFSSADDDTSFPDSENVKVNVEKEEQDKYNYGSQQRRKQIWRFDFLFLDIFMTIRMFNLTSYYGILSSLIILDETVDWKKQIEAKKRPLTIITMQDPLFIVSDFESMRGFEKKQHQFARIFLYFADSDKTEGWFNFFSLKDNRIEQFLLKKKNVLLSESSGSGVYDTILRFSDSNPDEKLKKKLIYSTVTFDLDLFCKDAPENYTFMTTIMEVLDNKDVNWFLKRVFRNMSARKWHNVYHGRMMTKYLLNEFTEVAFWVVPENKPAFYYNKHASDFNKNKKKRKVIMLCERTKKCTVYRSGDKEVSKNYNVDDVYVANFLVN